MFRIYIRINQLLNKDPKKSRFRGHLLNVYKFVKSYDSSVFVRIQFQDKQYLENKFGRILYSERGMKY